VKIIPRFTPFWRFFFALFLLSLPAASGKALSPVRASPIDQQPDLLAAPTQPLGTIETLVMPPVDVTALLLEDELRASQGLPPRFAQPIAVDVTPSNHGTWETLADGTRLWRLRIRAEDALSLNLGFARYYMPEGGSLVLYSPDRSRLAGPFTAADNEKHGQLWSPILLGDEIVIEVSLPADQASNLELALTSVNYGYAAFGKPHTITSGACNVDVVCPEGDPWRDQIRSVAVISINGTFACTGFLVNNTAQDLKGYFMTANHCGLASGNAASLVAYWNYENPVCRPPGSSGSGGPGDGSLDQYNTGSIFRSSYSTSDFTLVELDDPINPAYNVYWAGWDHGGNDATSATAIHHPNVDEKRISFEYQPTTVTSYLLTLIPGDGTHVRITDWDLGTTEGGSSGSPLFDQNHRIIGQLHGGYAACGNDSSDWYGRFFISWTGGGTSATRLSNWLDPLNSGQLTLDGRDRIESPFTLVTTPSEVSICAPDPAVYGITVTQETPGYLDPVTLNAYGAPAGALALFSVNPVIPTYTSTLTISQTELAAPGSYDLDLIGVEATNTFTTTVTLNLFSTVPGLATLLTPADGAVNQPSLPVFTWIGAPHTSGYNFRLDLNPLFPHPAYTGGLTDPVYTPASPLQGGTCYWWSVQDRNTCGDGIWSEPFHFATSALDRVFSDDIEAGAGLWTHAAVQGTDHWAVSATQSHSPANAWFVPDDSTTTDSGLWTASPVAVGSGSQLSFWHRYQFEGSSFDGAVLEISTNGGSTWSDLGANITVHGYTGAVNSGYSNPLAGRSAWVSDLTTWTKVEVDLNSFAGQNALIRWRIGCDSSIGDVGWYIDDVQITAPLPANPAPVLLGIEPDSGPIYENTPVVITGTHFITTPTLSLGDTWLISVTQVSSSTLEAVVPAGIPGGTYTLTLYNGDCQVSVLPGSFTVTEVSIPIAGLSAQNNSPTELGHVTTLSATVTAGNQVSYGWDFGDGTSGAGARASHIYPALGVYTAVVTATNITSEAVAFTLVTIVDEPILGLDAVSDGPSTLGDTTSFTATLTAGTNVTYTWDFGDGSPAAHGPSVAHTYADVGEFTVTVTASNSRGIVYDTVVVFVVAPPRQVYLMWIWKNGSFSAPPSFSHPGGN